MTGLAIAACVIVLLSVLTVGLGAWAARGERKKLEKHARRYGVQIHSGMSSGDIEAAINRRCFGWRTR